MADKFIKIRKLYAEGNNAGAALVQEEANEVISVLVKVGVLPAEKEIMGMLGVDCGKCRKPFKEVTSEERKLLEKVVHDYLLTEGNGS